MITIADFRTRFPEFADETEYPDARIQLFIDDSVEDIGSDENRWCGKYDRAQAYYVAHLLFSGTKTEAGDTGSSVGPISSKTAGGVSVTRATVAKDRSDNDDWLSSTPYGMQFLVIRDSCFVGYCVANKL